MGSTISVVAHNEWLNAQQPIEREHVRMQTDIEVLKTKLENLDKSVMQVNDKLDTILSMQVQLVRLQEQHDNTREGLTRAFNVLNMVQDHTNKTEAKLETTLSFVRGGVFVGVILFGFALWYVEEQLTEIKQVTDRSSSFEHRLSTLEQSGSRWPTLQGGEE